MGFEEILILGIIPLGVLLIGLSVFRKTKEEKEHEKRIAESLADELIYDPETGMRITLDQAESGYSVAHINPNRLKSKAEIDKYYLGEDKAIEELNNDLIRKGYTAISLSDEQTDFLEKSHILSKYDDWFYSDAFTFNQGESFIFFPHVTYFGSEQHMGYDETQIMFWIEHSKLSGHVYLRDKTSIEAWIDLISNDDEIKLNNYETFVHQRPTNIIQVLKVLKLFENETGLEIEINGNNLFIKTTKLANTTDFIKVEHLIKKVA